MKSQRKRPVSFRRPRACALLLALCPLAMPGCVVGDIRDEMVALNAKVARVSDQLDTLEIQLQELETLTPVNERLAVIDQELAQVDERMVAVNESLDLTNAHLGSLRRTITNIDSTIPFLKIADDEDPETEAMQPDVDEPGEADGETHGETHGEAGIEAGP